MENKIIVGNVRITVITESLIRIEEADNGNFIDEKTLFAENREFNNSEFFVDKIDNKVIINTPYVKLTYINDGEPINKTNLFAEVKGTESKWYFGKKNEGNLGGAKSTLDGVESFEEVEEGLLSTDGWYVIDDSRKPLLVDDWIAPRNTDSITDIYLFAYGNDYKKALKTLTYVSGKMELPRKYVFGSWYSRWWPYTQDEILGIVDGYDDNDFPLDILVIDMDWHYNDWSFDTDEERVASGNSAKAGFGHASNLGWTGYSWNKKLIPEPERLLDELHKRDIYVTLNDHPADGIRTHEDCYENFKQEMGVEGNIDLKYDASNKKYIEAVFNNAHTPLEKSGIDFWWVDWQQDYLMPYVKTVPGTRHLPWLNYLYYAHSKKNNKRGLGFSRWGCWGDQKRPIYFSGDTKSTWEVLQFEIEFNIKSANVGCCYWAHDLGGFFGERNPEMFVRWVQFGLTNATLRVHSQRDEVLDRCPWKWGEKECEAMRKVYHLRSRLIPYIYSIAYKTYETSVPFIRGMYIEYPDDEKAYENMQQYFFGDAFIAAPITMPGKGEEKQARQKVWLKEGKWYNIFDDKEYFGGSEQEIECDLMSFPLLAKGGMPIPMQSYSNRMTSAKLTELEILCYPGEDNKRETFILYEDDGVSNGYKNGEFLKTEISYEKRDKEIIILLKPQGKGYEEMVRERRIKIILPLTDKLKCSSVCNVQAFYDEKARKNEFVLENIETKNEICLKFN